MRVIVAGSRTITNRRLVEAAIRSSGFEITCLISGGAPGVDRLGEGWAHSQNIPVHCFPAEWKTYGREAGPIRNQKMAQNADALIAIWDGKSPGTKDMIFRAKRLCLKLYVYRSDLVGDAEDSNVVPLFAPSRRDP